MRDPSNPAQAALLSTKNEVTMATMGRRGVCGLLMSAAIAISSFVFYPDSAPAAEVGERAPDFKLPSTMGGSISLGDYRGKKWVLLEFYGADFSPV
jgi:hypothetical protein